MPNARNRNATSTKQAQPEKNTQKIRPLTGREQEILHLFAVYAATALSFWRFWKYNIQFQIIERADLHWQMAYLADSVAALPHEQFLQQVLN